MEDGIVSTSSDFWVKVVGMLQQNWALIELIEDNFGRVYFLDDCGGVFDEMNFGSVAEAAAGLSRNGFKRFVADAELQSFLFPPSRPFFRRQHPSGRIYSSGRFWSS